MPQQNIVNPNEWEDYNANDWEDVETGKTVPVVSKPTFGSRVSEFGSGLFDFGKNLFGVAAGNPQSISNIGRGLVYDPLVELSEGRPLRAAAKFTGFNPDAIYEDWNEGNYGALAGDILPQFALGALTKGAVKYGSKVGAKPQVNTPTGQRLLTGRVPEVLPAETPLPSNIRQLGAAPERLQLPALGESSYPPGLELTPEAVNNARFYSGPSGLADIQLSYPHIIDGQMVPNIGPELAASRTVPNPKVSSIQKDPVMGALIPDRYKVEETIPFETPSGYIKPNPVPVLDKFGRQSGVPPISRNEPTLGATLEQPIGGAIIEPPPIEPNLGAFSRGTLTPEESLGFRGQQSGTGPSDPTLIIPSGRSTREVLKGPEIVENKIKSGQNINGTELKNSLKAITSGGWKRELFNLPRALMAWDLSPISSAAWRQAFPQVFFKDWRTAWPDMIKAYGSEGAYRATMDSIGNNKNFKLANDSGVKFTDLSDFTGREEMIMSKWAEKVKLPGTEIGSVRASNRSYTAFLNKLRMDTFSRLVDDARKLGREPDKNLVLTKEIANYVNNSTGRGALRGSNAVSKWIEKNAAEMNSIFFSPRNTISRLQMVNPKNYLFIDPFVRKQYWKSLGAMSSAWVTIGALAKLAGADVGLDPTSSDFGKIKVGDTRLDPAAGFQQELVLMSKFMSGLDTSSTSGITRNIGEDRNARSRFDLVRDFGVNKLNPPVKLATDWLLDSPQRPFDPSYHELVMPMVLSDIVETFQKDPALLPLVTGVNTVFPGWGASTYGGR